MNTGRWSFLLVACLVLGIVEAGAVRKDPNKSRYPNLLKMLLESTGPTQLVGIKSLPRSVQRHLRKYWKGGVGGFDNFHNPEIEVAADKKTITVKHLLAGVDESTGWPAMIRYVRHGKEFIVEVRSANLDPTYKILRADGSVKDPEETWMTPKEFAKIKKMKKEEVKLDWGEPMPEKD